MEARHHEVVEEQISKEGAPRSPMLLRLLLCVQLPSLFWRGAIKSASALVPSVAIVLPVVQAAAAATSNVESE